MHIPFSIPEQLKCLDFTFGEFWDLTMRGRRWQGLRTIGGLQTGQPNMLTDVMYPEGTVAPDWV